MYWDFKEEFCFVFSAVIMTLEMKLFYLQFIEKNELSNFYYYIKKQKSKYVLMGNSMFLRSRLKPK